MRKGRVADNADMDSKSFAAAAYRVEHPSKINRRSRRGTTPQAVRVDQIHARDPLAYPSSRPRPEGATKPLLSFEWTETKAAATPVVEAEVPVATPSEPVRLMPSQRAHLLRPLTLRGSDGRQTYVTYTVNPK